MNLDLLSLPYK